MQIHQLKRNHPNKTSQQVGRGGTRGKTSGRGGKGQTARAGHKVRPEMRDVIKRMPKLRGRGKNINTSRQEKPIVISLDRLQKKFPNGGVISPKELIDQKLISLQKGKIPKVKILGDGEVSTKIELNGLEVSASAKTKIEKAGGKVNATAKTNDKARKVEAKANALKSNPIKVKIEKAEVKVNNTKAKKEKVEKADSKAKAK
ncbi:MAG: uL15 family ribosomal protein [Candidatus Paceibacterota bacterium]